jgi:ribonuclease HII
MKYTQALYSQGFRLVAGVDEAGRGPLAGPVVAAAVVLAPGVCPDGVDDSKKLSPHQRTQLAERIQQTALCYGIGMVDAKTIDTINILQATLLAMAQAVRALSPAPDAVLVDGTHAPTIPMHCVCLPHGDALDASIAAASILAKVFRDAWMQKLHEQYPVYGFDRHKGYPTAAHRAAIQQYEPCPQHRSSFRVKVQ